mgnify:CR=1 FL=1
MSHSGTKFTKSVLNGVKSRCRRKFPRAKIDEDINHMSMKIHNADYECRWAAGNWEYFRRFLRKNVGRSLNNIQSDFIAAAKAAKCPQELIDTYTREFIPGNRLGSIGGPDNPKYSYNDFHMFKFYVDENGILRENKKEEHKRGVFLGNGKYYYENDKSYKKKLEYNEKMIRLPEQLHGAYGPIPCGKAWVITNNMKAELRNIALVRCDERSKFTFDSSRPGTPKKSEIEYVKNDFESVFVIGRGMFHDYHYEREGFGGCIYYSTYSYQFYAYK